MTYTAPIQITEKMIWEIFPTIKKAKKTEIIKGFVYTYNKYAGFFGIDTPLEVAHFIAQIGHECDQFNTLEEYASGAAYEGRKDLGNIYKGDGVKFKGRGELQTTGRINYTITGRKIAELPFLNAYEKNLFANDGILKKPEILADPVWGTLASFIYWTEKDLNALCQPDTCKVVIKRFNGKKWYNYECSPIEALTRKINGGMNGFADRVEKYIKVKSFLKPSGKVK